MFNRKLKFLRERKELAQGTVAGMLNLTQATYSRYESGVHQPDFITLKRIANFFNVSIDYLLDNDDNLSNIEEFVDLKKFIMNGKYTVNARFPTDNEREMLNEIINAIFKERER